MPAWVVCFAQVTLNTIRLDLGADPRVFHVIILINWNSLITEVFKTRFSSFRGLELAGSVFRYCTLNSAIFITESKVITSRPSTHLPADDVYPAPPLIILDLIMKPHLITVTTDNCIHCHLAFIIRDINSCRKGYSKGRLKSRETDHFNIQIAFKLHHKTLRHS